MSHFTPETQRLLGQIELEVDVHSFGRLLRQLFPLEYEIANAEETDAIEILPGYYVALVVGWRYLRRMSQAEWIGEA